MLQSGANCVVRRINPHFMGLLHIKDLQDWSRCQGFFQGLKCSFLRSFLFELDGLLRQIGQGLGDGGKTFDKPPVEIRKPQEPLHLTYTRRSWP